MWKSYSRLKIPDGADNFPIIWERPVSSKVDVTQLVTLAELYKLYKRLQFSSVKSVVAFRKLDLLKLSRVLLESAVLVEAFGVNCLFTFLTVIIYLI